MDLQVRPMSGEEKDVVLDLISRSIRVLNARDYTPLEIEEVVDFYDSSSLSFGTIVVAEKGSQIVGVAKSSLHSYLTQSIDAVFVEPSFVRKGIGKALLQEIERRALDAGIKKIVVSSSLTAVAFYKALGYEYLKEADLGGVLVVLMKKQLKPFTPIDRVVGVSLIVVPIALVLICWLFLLW